ncbi:DNA-directed RNA polymerase subunit omega [Peptoniphilus sp. GNH]|nr:DNA-directed RNA polymerase, omega subunit [Clostridiales bacterium KA00134]UHR02976.1 DNA-directed RNA polymerase subunit omega [Peptoniphilus sp. GNH]
MLIPSFSEIKEITNSRYALVMLVSKRARIISEGNPTFVESENPNPVTLAMKEILEGDIKFGQPMSDKAYAEKIEAQREAKLDILLSQEKDDEEEESAY